LSMFIGVIQRNEMVFKSLVGAVVGATSAFLIYKGVMIAIVAVKAAVTAASVTLSAVLALQAQGVGILKAAWILLNITMSANPIGLIILGVGALVGILAVLTSSTNTQKSAQQIANDEMQEAVDLARRARDMEQKLSDQRLALEGTTLGVERAQRTYNEAVENYGEESLEAREAAHNLEVAENRLKDKQAELKTSTEELTQVQEAHKDMIQGVIDKLDGLDGKSVSYTVDGNQRFMRQLEDGSRLITGSFSQGGFTGRGGTKEIAGIVHKGEYIMPKEMVNQSTGIPKIPSFRNSQQSIPSSFESGNSSSNSGDTINIERLELPNVQSPDDFVRDMKLKLSSMRGIA